jgi:putative sigma-54 modulation protein
MVITVTGRHLEITPAIRAHAEEKANHLTKYYDLIQAIEVILDANDGKTRTAEMIVNAENKAEFIARISGQDLYGCIDQVAHKLERQLVDYKERMRNKLHS